MTDPQFEKRINGYSLTTAEIFYRFPDYPQLLQSFVWQDYDCAPRFPKLGRFLIYWASHLDGGLHRVRIAHKRLVEPVEYRVLDGQIILH